MWMAAIRLWSTLSPAVVEQARCASCSNRAVPEHVCHARMRVSVVAQQLNGLPWGGSIQVLSFLADRARECADNK
jgi:hypothetical protein